MSEVIDSLAEQLAFYKVKVWIEQKLVSTGSHMAYSRPISTIS